MLAQGACRVAKRLPNTRVMPSQTLAEFTATFDRASLKPVLDEAEQQRAAILAAFPLASIADLPLERYALRDRDRSTLCYLLEYGSAALGSMKGGSADKLGVYYQSKSARWKSVIPGIDDPHAAWESLRYTLVKAFELGAHGEWEKIDALPLAQLTAALRTKLLNVYFPNEVISIYSLSHLTYWIETLGGSLSGLGDKSTAAANRRVVTLLRGLPFLEGWSLIEIGHLLYQWNPPPQKKNAKAAAIDQREAILQALRDLTSGAPEGNDAFHFDVVRNHVRETFDGLDIKACSTVMADMVPPERGGNRSSSVPVHLRVLERVEPGVYRIAGSDQLQESTPLVSQSPSQVMHAALNQILYGPPGTGKTYNVIRRAAKFATGRDDLSDAEAKQQYDELSKAGRIRLATFHQSFSYEDFIEGIRPVMEEGGAARFEVRDGVFKEIAAEALFACLERTSSNPVTGSFEARWQALMTEVEASDDRLPIPGVLPNTVFELSRLKSGNLSVKLQSGTLLHGSRSKLERIYAKCHDKQRINSGEAHRAAVVSGHHNANAAIFNYMQTLKPLADVPVTLSSDDRLEIVSDYLREGPASGWQLRADKVFPPYVLIIDEINRGNISRIFGELITLIEDDKRHGTDNALTVTLPTSRELFTVPPNLFLLGTMNTADKSLALLDVALRRRFEFEELAPDFTCCSGFPPLRAVMDEMNLRLELSKDRDHRIGHAFFMGVTDAASFNQVFRRKVVPLLQEYFFNDIDGARYVLGDTGDTGFLRALRREDRQRRTAWRWFTDEEQGRRENEKLDCWARLRSNYGIGDV